MKPPIMIGFCKIQYKGMKGGISNLVEMAQLLGLFAQKA